MASASSVHHSQSIGRETASAGGAGVGFGVGVFRLRSGTPGDPRNTTNTLSPVRARLKAARIEATGRIAGGNWTAGVGYEDVTPRVGNNRDDLRFYAGWSHDFDIGR